MEVQKLEDLQQQLVEERERLSEKLEKHEIYQKFMQKVLDQSEEFSETREIIDRYNTLVATHSDLLDREQLNQVTFCPVFDIHDVIVHASNPNHEILESIRR